jgi:cardiolipin synthase
MLSDLLLAKRRAGVAVNVIYDSFGSSDTPSAFFERLAAAGATVLAFNPVNPLEARVGYAPNNRDHRKLLVADGTTAIVGGINLSTAYQSTSIGKSGAGGKALEPDAEAWRDTALQIDGPAVADLQRLFFESWTKQKGPPLVQARYFPRIAPRGGEVVRILGSAPENAVPSFHVALLSAIAHAEESVWLTNAYFIPTDEAATALRDAARRGIDVRLLLPGRSDSGFSLAAARSHYAAMLAAGVRIYEFGGAVLHAKSAVVDGVWSVIGSSNVDHRSVLYNDEVDAVVVGAATGREMRRLFQESLREAKAIDAEAWAARPLTQRFKETFTRLWEKLL